MFNNIVRLLLQLAVVGVVSVNAAPWWEQWQPQHQQHPQRQPRIADGTPATDAEMHACILLISRANIAAGRAAMGSGSIVSRNRVLTAAHVIVDATAVTVGFYSGRMQTNRFRRGRASYSQPMQSYVVETFANDLAVVQFDTDIFPSANVIAIAAAAPTGRAFVASYGFTRPNSLEPSQLPNVSEQLVDACGTAVANTPSHFCATAQGTSVVCLGANGAGLYTGTGTARRLVGVASLVQPECTGVARVTAYTALSGAAVQRFLSSQGLATVA